MFTSSSFPFHAPILHRRHNPLPSTITHPLCFHPHNLAPHPRTPSFLRPPPLQLFPPAIFTVAAKSPTADKSGEQKWVHEGLITESLPNGMFRVRLDNEDLILGYISGRIRKNYVRILPGDRVRVEVRVLHKERDAYRSEVAKLKKAQGGKDEELKKALEEKAASDKTMMEIGNDQFQNGVQQVVFLNPGVVVRTEGVTNLGVVSGDHIVHAETQAVLIVRPSNDA